MRDLTKRHIGVGVALATILAVGCGQGSGTYVSSARSGPGGGYAPVAVDAAGSIPAGTTLWVTLDHRISARSSRVGDEFHGRVAEEVVSSYGDVLVPRGATVTGRVADIRAGRGSDPAYVALAVDTINMGGVSQRISGTIVDADIPGERRVRGRDVLVGAAAGAILGGLAEGSEGALVGGALGAGAGSLVSLGRGGSSALPRGTSLAIRLETPVRSLAAIESGRVY